VTTWHKQSDSFLNPGNISQGNNQWRIYSKHKSKSNPDPATGKKTSLLILLEAAGVRIQKVQNPVHAHLWQSSRGEHGQDQDWISRKILAIFLDQDWIWIFIFDKNRINTGQDISLISITKFPWEWFKMSQMMVLVLFNMVFIFTKNQNDFISMCSTHHNQW